MRFLVPIILTVAPLAALPVQTSLTLVEGDPNFNRLALTVTPADLPGDTDTTILTSVPGQPVLASLDIDPTADTISSLSIQGGRVTGSNTSFSGNALVASYSINLSNLGGQVFTPAPPAPVDPLTGSFDASLHQFEIDQGSVTGSFWVLFVGTTPISQSFSPTESVGGAGTGTGSTTLMQIGSTAFTNIYELSIVIPVDVTEVTESGGQTVNVRAVGTLKASGTVEVALSEYLAWTLENGIDGAAGSEDANADGVPNGIAWALGLDATSSGRAFLPKPVTGNPRAFQITLPPGGTAAPLFLQSSPNLADGGLVDPLRISTGVNPLPAGSTGTVTIEPSGAPREFIRLQSPE